MNTQSLLSANKIHTTYRASLLQLADALSAYPFLRQKENELRAVADNLQSPFNVAIFGRMKTGKSSLINALIGKRLAITGVEEATATINRLTYAGSERLNQFTVHWQDAQPETFQLERLQQDWSGKTPEVLERISRTAWLELYSDAPILRDIHITDTPGTGATAEEHEVIAKQFINGQSADALLYVFSPTGRESDEADLKAFRAGCLPGSSLDNSVAVLHKWDHIYWDEDNMDSIRAKAERVKSFMQDTVSAVIPVSAPLAMMAKTADAAFWSSCHAVLSTFSSDDDLCETLGDQDEWDEEEPREALYQKAKALGCPLASFRIMLRHLYRHREVDAAACIYELSGLQQLETLLDRQIFSMRSVIQQKQNCARARKVMDDVYTAIEQELERHQTDIDMMEQVYELLDSANSRVRCWMDSKRGEMKMQHASLTSAYRNLDSLRIRVRNWADAIINAHDLTAWLKDYERLGISQSIAGDFTAFLKALLPNAIASQELTVEKLMQLLPYINRLDASPRVEDKAMSARLHQCLMQWFSQQQ